MKTCLPRSCRIPYIINKASNLLAAAFPKPHILGQTGEPPRGAGASTSTPKPRVESSNLSAPATKSPEIARFQAVFLSFAAVRGLAKSSSHRAEHQIVHCVTRFRNRSVWYSIKKASGDGGVHSNDKPAIAYQQLRALTIALSFRTSKPNFLYSAWASLVIKTPRSPEYSGNDTIYDIRAVPSPLCWYAVSMITSHK